jgi:hypothetical protein
MPSAILLRTLHNEELREENALPSIIRIMKSIRKLTVHGEQGKKKTYGLLVEKPEGKGPLGRPRRKWIEMDI